MVKQYCISDAGNNIENIIEYAEREPCVELMRQGKTVAVVLSSAEYRRLARPRNAESPKPSRWQSLDNWMAMCDREGIDLSDVYSDIRDKSPGRSIEL
jgi:prevent-host-death family protein